MSTFMLPMREDQIATLDYSSKDLGHLGIVATVCKEICLTDDKHEETQKKKIGKEKDQQHAERGFRFLKDPLFFAHSLFLKNDCEAF